MNSSQPGILHDPPIGDVHAGWMSKTGFGERDRGTRCNLGNGFGPPGVFPAAFLSHPVHKLAAGHTDVFVEPLIATSSGRDRFGIISEGRADAPAHRWGDALHSASMVGVLVAMPLSQGWEDAECLDL